VVDLLDGDVAVQQFVAGSPHPCRRPASDDLASTIHGDLGLSVS
jgi:hypothetical protein